METKPPVGDGLMNKPSNSSDIAYMLSAGDSQLHNSTFSDNSESSPCQY